MPLGRILLALALFSVLSAVGLSGADAGGGNVMFVQNGVFTHPADKGTWKMTGAIADAGTFVGVCAPCNNQVANLRRAYRGKKGTFVLLHRITFPKDSWTLLSGTGFYKGLHGKGTCIVHIIVNEVSFRDPCAGVISR